MIDYPIIRSEIKNPRGFIVHTMFDNKLRQYSDVRMGLVWPTAKSPAYFVVVGEAYLGIFQDEENPDKRGKLTVMEEREFRHLSIENLCSGVYDAVKIYGVRTTYVDYDENDPEYYDALLNYGYKHKLRSMRVVDAPFKRNFQAGLAMVSDWWRVKLLDIPKGTIVHKQMSGLHSSKKKSSLDQPDADQIYYAANALRYVVSGFYKFRPTCYWKRETWRHKNRRGMAV